MPSAEVASQERTHGDPMGREKGRGAKAGPLTFVGALGQQSYQGTVVESFR